MSTEVIHDITSLVTDQFTPEDITGLLRQHWTVGNTSHWVRDVVYRNDHHVYAGTGAQVMATLRNLTLGLLRLAGPPDHPYLHRIAADRTRILPSSRPLPAQTDFEIPLLLNEYRSAA